jgi:hypothetical protein
MSRKDHQRRRQREAQWKQAVRARQTEPVPAVIPGEAEPVVAVLTDFEITWEPMQDDYPKPAKVREQEEELFDLVHLSPAQAAERLRPLVEEFPNIPMLYNWLSTALAQSGRMDEADAVIEFNYRRNPDYLFAKANYAELCLRRGEPDKVPAIFNNQFSLTSIYPGRNRFHITEFTGFMAIMVFYFQQSGQLEMAERYFKMLEDVAPDEPQTQKARAALHSPALRVLGQLMGALRRRKKR